METILSLNPSSNLEESGLELHNSTIHSRNNKSLSEQESITSDPKETTALSFSEKDLQLSKLLPSRATICQRKWSSTWQASLTKVLSTLQEELKFLKNQSKAAANKFNSRFLNSLLLIELIPDSLFKFLMPAEKSHPTNSITKKTNKKQSLLRLSKYQKKNKIRMVRKLRSKKDKKSKSRKKPNNNQSLKWKQDLTTESLI